MSSGRDRAEIDLLVRNAFVITMDRERRVFPNGAVATDAGAIVAVGADREVSEGYRSATTIDAHGAVVHPGFIDNHIHLLYHNIRWAIPDGAGWEAALPAHSQYMQLVDDDTEYVGAKLSALEMATNGTTCFLESGGVMNTDAAASAVEEVGIRAVLGDPFVRDVVAPGGGAHTRIPQSRERAFDVLGTELKRNSDPDALVRGAVCLSGMGTVSEELQLHAKALADQHGVVLNQHQSYQQTDAEEDDRRLGRHPLVHYAEIGLLGENCTFSHMNILREDEVAPVVESGMSVVWCPMASMLFGVGGTIHGRHAELHKQGANVALGCDSANWTSAFDIGEEAFVALMTAREKTGRPDMLVAEDVLEMATVNGARAVGMADRLGSLEAGKRADLVVRRQDMPEALPGLDPMRSVVYSGRSKSVDTVVVNGRVIVKDGRSTRFDEAELYARSRELSLGVMRRMGLSAPQGRWPRLD